MSTQSKLSEARKLEARGDFMNALNAYSEILKSKPANMPAIDGALSILEKRGDPASQLKILDLKCRAAPRNVDAWIKAGIAYAQLRHNAPAIEAFEVALQIDPGNGAARLNAAKLYSLSNQFVKSASYFETFIEAFGTAHFRPLDWAFYAHALARALTSPLTSTQILEEAFGQVKGDVEALSNLSTTAKQVCDHPMLDRINEALFQLGGTQTFTPERWVHWVRSLEIQDRKDRIAVVGARALSAINEALTSESQMRGYTKSDILMARARINHLLGNPYEGDIDEAWNGVDHTPSLANIKCPNPDLADVFHQNFARWQDRFKGKDVFFLLTGPSLKLVEAKLDGLQDKDDIRFISLNDFEPTIDRIVAPLGRTLDGIIMLNGDHFAANEERLIELISEDDGPFLITKKTMIAAQTRSDEFLARPGNLMLLYSHFGGTPSPENGLTYEFENSLSIMVSFLMTAEARRIFLCGADAGATDGAAKVHFGDEAETSASDLVARNYLHQLEKEAEVSDHILDYQLPVIARNYDVAIPEIYTVCPHSNHKLFKRIDMDEALRILTETNS